MDNSTFFPEEGQFIGASSIEESELLDTSMPSLSPSLNFDAPVKTTEQLRQGLISMMGPEQGQKMFDEFIKSVITMSINTLKKEIDRAQRAAKRMRAVYHDLHG